MGNFWLVNFRNGIPCVVGWIYKILSPMFALCTYIDLMCMWQINIIIVNDAFVLTKTNTHTHPKPHFQKHICEFDWHKFTILSIGMWFIHNDTRALSISQTHCFR